MWKLWRFISKLWHYIVILLAAVVITCIILPLILSLTILLFPLRTFVKLVVAPIYVPNLVGIFRGKAVFCALEPVYTQPKMNILLHFVINGRPPPIEEIRKQFQERVLNYSCDKTGKHPYDPLRQRWTELCGFIFWQWDTSFSLSHHIRYYDYAEPELRLPEVCTTEEDLKRVSGDLVAKPYRNGSSPWEILVIPRYKSKSNETQREQMVLLLRIHHALGDGFSILKMMLKFSDWEDTKLVQPHFPNPSRWKNILRMLVTPIRLPFDIASLLVVHSIDGPNPWHLFARKLSGKYEIFVSDPVPVWKIKAIKNRHRVGYNAAVYTVVIRAMRKLMIEAGQEVPKRMSCLVPSPLPHHPGGLVIHAFGLTFTFSPRGNNPVVLLHKISRSFRTLQDSYDSPLIINEIFELATTLPVWILRLFYDKLMTTTAMTSFPGPQQERQFMGVGSMTDIIPVMSLPPGIIGVGAVLVSMAGKQRIVVTADKEIFRSHKVPTNFVKHINDEVEELLNLGCLCAAASV